MIPKQEEKSFTPPKLVDSKTDIHTITRQEVKLTPEQLKLQQANAINDILSSRVVKKKGNEYDSIELRIRDFLNSELAHLLGTANQTQVHQLPFSSEEITLLKALANRVKDKRA